MIFPSTKAQKRQVERVYLLRLSNIPCRYFTASLCPRAPPPRNALGRTPPHGRLRTAPWCPFGNECHYRHEKEPGVKYLFDDAQKARAMWGRRYAVRQRFAGGPRWGRPGADPWGMPDMPEWVVGLVDSDFAWPPNGGPGHHTHDDLNDGLDDDFDNDADDDDDDDDDDEGNNDGSDPFWDGDIQLFLDELFLTL